MSKAIFTISVAFSVVLLYLSFQTFYEGRQIRRQAQKLVEKNRLQEGRASDLLKLSDGPVETIGHYYEKIDEHLRMYSGFYHLQNVMLIQGLGADGLIGAATKPSVWEGIGQVDIKIHFFNVAGIDQFLNIFELFTKLQQQCPLNIVAIRQSGKNLEASIQLYGNQLMEAVL